MDSPEFEALRAALTEVGQGHLFEALDSGEGDQEELGDHGDLLDEHGDALANTKNIRLIRQLLKLDARTPGGLVDYCKRARRLLEAVTVPPSNPENRYTPPKLGQRLKSNTPLFEECEEIGLSQTPFTAFVLVAGGIGERLNFPHAKVSLKTDTLTGKSFLQHHCDWVYAMQRRAQIIMDDPDWTLPLVIMTSDDTHSAIIEMLSSSDSSGMLSGLTDVTVLKQDKVACFSNLNGDIALNPNDAFEVITKPHGHGDIHLLLHRSGLVEKWHARGLQWVVTFQDTNALLFRSIAAALGSASRNRMDMSMVAVQRRRGEAVGVICHDNEQERTLNVEYNLVDEDMFGSESSSSVFPGNINILIISISSYAEALQKSGGIIPEFVNPKFADSAKTEFKSPARLECMMQDLPLILKQDARIGYIEMERFLCYSPVKNNPKDALSKYQETGYPESASSAESDLYSTGRRLLAMSGCQIRTTGLGMRRFESLPFEDGARIVLNPSFGTTVAEIRSRFPTPKAVHISDRSALVLDGDIIIHSLELDGHLVINAAPNSRIIIKALRVINEGSILEGMSKDEDDDKTNSITASERIRGFYLRTTECLSIISDQPGETIIERPFN